MPSPSWSVFKASLHHLKQAVPEQTPELVDLHSHLLPGVDDGSRTPEQSARVIQSLVASGVREICLTPHVSLSQTAGQRRSEILARFAVAFEKLVAVVPPGSVRLRSGAEVMVDEPPSPRHDLSPPMTLGDSDAVLIEFPVSITAAAILGAVRAMRDRGLVPLIAHPERYTCCTSEVVSQWRLEGAWVQIDATTAAFGERGRGDRARSLLHDGVADLLAGDNHGDARSLGAAYRALCDSGHGLAAEQMCSVAPRALLANGVRPSPLNLTLGSASKAPGRKSAFQRLRNLWRPG
jgi:protein-tyrosine phosphatase